MNNMPTNGNHIKNLVKSFKFAFRGINFCLKNERNMRIHLVIAVLVGVFAVIFGLTTAEYAILAVSIFFVIGSEMVNTSIEALIDFQTGAYADLARVAKDVAAGAVLISALSAVVVGLFLFLKPLKLKYVLIEIFTTPAYILMFAFIIIFGTVFIIKGYEIFRIKRR